MYGLLGVTLQANPTIPWDQLPKTPFALLAFAVVVLGVISYFLVTSSVKTQWETVQSIKQINVVLTNHFAHDAATHAAQIEIMRQIVDQNREIHTFITEERVLRRG